MNIRTEVSGEPARQIPDLRFLERIDEWADSEPGRFAFAVDHSDRVEEYTYHDVFEYSIKVARSLAASGVGPGDRVGILMDNSPHWVFVILGAIRLGAIGVPLSTLLPADSVRRLVKHSECRQVFTDSSNLDTALEALGGSDAADSPSDALAVRLIANAAPREGATTWDQFLAEGEGRDWKHAEAPDGSAVLVYTSGTTGDPKGVLISAQGMSSDVDGIIELIELSPDHRILSVLPFSHVLPLVANGLGALAAGCGVVFLPTITPQRIVEAFKKHRISFFVCVPQFFYVVHKRIFGQVAEQSWLTQKLFAAMMSLSRMVKSPKLSRRLFRKIHESIGPDLDLLITGGSRFEPRIAADFQALGYSMVQAYGLTETTAAATITPVKQNEVGTVGQPLRGVTIRIDQANDEGVGEVCISGPVLMSGYYRNPEATADAVRDGWLHTGDLGRLDSDGNLTLTGRSKDVIVLSSGKNIYPEEVEEHYEKSPFIKEMCVMGLPEASGPGDTLHAVVVPDLDEFRMRNQTAIGDMIRYELENRSRALASFMRVHSRTIQNDALPRTVTRKLKRFAIYENEVEGIRSKEAPLGQEDDESLRSGVGAIIAKAVHEAKPDLGSLQPDMNFDLDLGFDSLSRVDLLAGIEADVGTVLAEEAASQIHTIGELVSALDQSSGSGSRARRSWKEKLTTEGDDELAKGFISDSNASLTYFGFPTIRLFGAIAKLPFRTKVTGLEKLPESRPYIICPNHVSYLDPFLLCSVLPFPVIRDIFILGYTDYLQGPIVSRLAASVNLVPVDPNANLTRAMRVSAIGLRKNRILLVFPEGERSFDGGLTQFKKGSAILSTELNAPIVPVGINGTYQAWPRGGKLKAHPVEIRIGDPIYPEKYRDRADPYSELNNDLKAAVAALLDSPEGPGR
jgi:long-chain acyl-CoA synthetase